MKRLLILLFFLSTGTLQADALPASGRITRVDLEGRTIVIDNIPFKINDQTTFTAEGSRIDPDRLEPGTAVTFDLNNALITRMEVESPIEFNE
jgi:hypothetical protein